MNAIEQQSHSNSMVIPKWTEDDARMAKIQGWDIFDVDCSGLLEIQKCDEAGLFDSDAEAVAYVVMRASVDEPQAVKALQIHMHYAYDLATRREAF